MGLLAILGLGEFEESVYESLAALASSTVTELARATGAQPRAVRAALRDLEARGLALALIGWDERFAIAPPEPALGALVHAHQQALALVHLRSQVLAQLTRQAGERRRPAELVAVITGSAAITAHYEQLQREAVQEVMVFDRPPYPRSGGTGVNPNPIASERMAAGVTYRSLYDRSLLDDPATFARVQGELAAGERGRVLANLPLKLAIGDRTMALLPLLDSDGVSDQAALLIRPSVLLDSLAALFEALWQRAVPLRPGMGSEDVGDTDPELRAIVALMAAGLTDDSIARHLGASERTVRRKIAAALQALGAETRFQAGLRASQLGWVVDN